MSAFIYLFIFYFNVRTSLCQTLTRYKADTSLADWSSESQKSICRDRSLLLLILLVHPFYNANVTYSSYAWTSTSKLFVPLYLLMHVSNAWTINGCVNLCKCKAPWTFPLCCVSNLSHLHRHLFLAPVLRLNFPTASAGSWHGRRELHFLGLTINQSILI